MNEYETIFKLHHQLFESDLHPFPPKGTGIKVSKEQGVYLIFSPERKVLHVGRTLRGKNGLNQRLANHLVNRSSFSIQYMKNKGYKLREGYSFKYLEVSNPRKRALLEALTTGLLCPAHIGTGEVKQ